MNLSANTQSLLLLIRMWFFMAELKLITLWFLSSYPLIFHLKLRLPSCHELSVTVKSLSNNLFAINVDHLKRGSKNLIPYAALYVIYLLIKSVLVLLHRLESKLLNSLKNRGKFILFILCFGLVPLIFMEFHSLLQFLHTYLSSERSLLCSN